MIGKRKVPPTGRGDGRETLSEKRRESLGVRP